MTVPYFCFNQWSRAELQAAFPDAFTLACTCYAMTDLHDIDCATVAATQPHAMVNDAGDVFYPDNAEDAEWFAREHDARPLSPEGLRWTS